jgi:hypothetical protein
MPDTQEDKDQGRNNCYKCKYTLTCELLKEWDRLKNLNCQLGVK